MAFLLLLIVGLTIAVAARAIYQPTYSQVAPQAALDTGKFAAFTGLRSSVSAAARATASGNLGFEPLATIYASKYFR